MFKAKSIHLEIDNNDKLLNIIEELKNIYTKENDLYIVGDVHLVFSDVSEKDFKVIPLNCAKIAR